MNNSTGLIDVSFQDRQRIQKAIVVSNYFVTPVILFFGSIGNVVIMLIMSRAMRKSNMNVTYKDSSFLMFSLAIVDQFVLMSVLLNWLYDVSFKLALSITGKLYFCRFSYFIIHIGLQMSSLCIGLLSIERSICLPRLQAQAQSHKTKFLLVNIGVFLLSVATRIHYFWTLKMVKIGNNDECVLHMSKITGEIYYWIDCLLTSIIPCVCVIAFNTRIILFLSSRKAKIEPNVWDKSSVNNRKLIRGQHQITRVLLIVTLLFVALNVPFRLLKAFENAKLWGQKLWILLRYITGIMWYLNSAVNFYCYLLLSHFRRQVKALFICQKP